MTRLLRSGLMVTPAVMLFCGVAPLHASLSVIDVFKNISYQQTSGTAPTTPVGYFTDVEAFQQTSGDFDSVTVTYPGPGSPLSLPLENPLEFGVGPGFATQAAMDAAFPFGTYTYTASNSSTSVSQTAAFNYLQDAYTTDIPALDALTFAALQGMDPTKPFTFNFNSFTPSSNADVGLTFLTVFGSSFSNGYSNTTTSAVMAANTLLPGATYSYELDFSDRVNGIDAASGVPFTIGFDVRTDGTFTTLSPEPSSMIPVAMAFLGIALNRLRKRPA